MAGGDCFEGRMTYEEFVRACKSFLKRSQTVKDDGPLLSWALLEGKPEDFGETTLSCTFTKATTIPLPDDKSVKSDDQANCALMAQGDEKESAASQQPTKELMQYRYDIVYNISHSVPVLYFMISKPCGTSLTLQQIWDTLDLKNKDDANNGCLWNVVSLQDHPILHVPFFCVHPCNNWAILIECFQNEEEEKPMSERVFISWLSLVGSQFGLKLSPKYFQ